MDARSTTAGSSSNRATASAPDDPDATVPVFSFLGDPRDASAPSLVLDHADQCAHARDHPRGLRAEPDVHGPIDGVGPRYCPSIEDKVNRFAGKDSHQIFLEPEGLTTHEVYPNGISTSLPFSVQVEAVHSIAGLEQRRHRPARLRDRVRLLRSARACARASRRGRSPACSSPGRSTARPATRRRRRRVCTPARTQRCKRAVTRPGFRPRPGLSRCPDRRPGLQGRDRAVPDVHQPGRIPAATA